MVMTILEARVAREDWDALRQAYQEAAQFKDAGLVQSFLVNNVKDAELWRIMTVWQSQEALDAMRSSGETPRGILIFRRAHAEPTLSIFKVDQQILTE